MVLPDYIPEIAQERNSSLTVYTLPRAKDSHTFRSSSESNHCQTHAEKVLSCHKATRVQLKNSYKCDRTKAFLLLFIYIWATVLETSNAIPVTASGQRLILHTSRSGRRHHQQLLQQHRSGIVPTPHRHHLHHRSVNMEDNGSQIDKGSCEKLVIFLGHLLNQAKNTKQIIMDEIEKYLQHSRFSKHSKDEEKYEKVVELWKLHSLDLGHPYQGTPSPNLNGKWYADPTRFKPLRENQISVQMINDELRKIYTTLKILQSSFESIKQLRQNQSAEILNDARNDHEKVKSINEVFEVVQRLLKIDLDGVVDAMRNLKMQMPNFDVREKKHNTKRELLEWLLLQEYINFTQHTVEVYEILREKAIGCVQQS